MSHTLTTEQVAKLRSLLDDVIADSQRLRAPCTYHADAARELLAALDVPTQGVIAAPLADALQEFSLEWLEEHGWGGEAER